MIYPSSHTGAVDEDIERLVLPIRLCRRLNATFVEIVQVKYGGARLLKLAGPVSKCAYRREARTGKKRQKRELCTSRKDGSFLVSGLMVPNTVHSRSAKA